MLKTFIWLFRLYKYICSIKTKQHEGNNIRHNHNNYIYFNCSYLFNQINLINMETIEQLVWKKKFQNEEFDANDFNDWAKENSDEAYKLLKEVTSAFPYLLEALIDVVEWEKFHYIEPELLKKIQNAINKATK